MNPFSVRGCHKGGKYTPYSYEDNRSWKECSQVSKQNSLAMERSNRIMPVTPCCIITEGELLTFPLRYQAGRVPACCLSGRFVRNWRTIPNYTSCKATRSFTSFLNRRPLPSSAFRSGHATRNHKHRHFKRSKGT